MQPKLTLIFNTHMPYVLGNGDIFREPENWLFEAITETYIPLFNILMDMDEYHFSDKKVVFSMTPCLMEQLSKSRERYLKYLETLEKIARFEVERCANPELFNHYQKYQVDITEDIWRKLRASSKSYLERIHIAQKFMAKYDLIEALQSIVNSKSKHFELWTSSPNHNFFPFFERDSQNYFAKRGVELFEKTFNRSPDGFWLPECAHMPGVEDALITAGVRKTAMTVPSIGLYHSDLKSGIYNFKDLEVLIHDFRIAKHIWQAQSDTLPSTPVYREFYRDMGHDVKPEYFHNLGIKLPVRDGKTRALWTGIKYHALATSDIDLGYKPFYDLEAAESQSKTDALTFAQILNGSTNMTHDNSNIILAFDTEIFGHWWHEGIWWLEHLFKIDLSRAG